MYGRGFLPAVGLLAGGGLWGGSDGSFGFRGTGTLTGPFVAARLDLGPKQEGLWSGPRLTVGASMPVNIEGIGPPIETFAVTATAEPATAPPTFETPTTGTTP